MRRVLAVAAAAVAILAPSVASADGHADETSVTLLHGIPDVVVDVAAAGATVVPGFEFGDTFDLTPFAGTSIPGVAALLAGTDTAAIGPIDFDVPAEGNWTVLAHLDADGAPAIAVFENDTSMTAAGEGRLTMRHAAAAPEVDVVLGDVRPVVNAANGDEAVLALPAGEVAGAQIAPTGGDPIVDVPTVEVVAGEDLIVYAVGSLADDTFTFLTEVIEVGAEAPAAVNTGAPIDSGVNTTLLALAAAALMAAGGVVVLRRRDTV
ncbi:MAG: DUF4397 domain-containing protein [Ilumatobacteraceae bacterium]